MVLLQRRCRPFTLNVVIWQAGRQAPSTVLVVLYITISAHDENLLICGHIYRQSRIEMVQTIFSNIYTHIHV